MPSRRLRIALKDHRRESTALATALHAAGHEIVALGEQADVLLLDLDPPVLLHRDLLDSYSEMGATIILYPHGAGGPILSYDGLFEPDPRVAANLVTGPGQAEFLRRIGYPSETHAIGWTYCERRLFRACDDVRHVVFGPTHPNGDGSMIPERRALNSNVFAELIKGPWKLTVRHIGTLEQNGLWEADGVTFVNGIGKPQFGEIDQADVVVAGDGSLPTLAIARGVPTVVYGQATLAWGLPDEPLILPKRKALYMDYIRYPFDFEDGPLEDTIRAAARSEAPVAHWKRRMLGEPFDALATAELVERIAIAGRTPVRIDPTRSHTTLAFADELVESPHLLREYVARVRASDDASLLLWAPGVNAQGLLAMAEQAIEAAGLDMDGLPDILLAPLPGSPEADLRLAERADALLSEWPSIGRIGSLPRFAPAALLV
jgi:hypothetical protein